MRRLVEFSVAWGARPARGNTLWVLFRRLTKCGVWRAGGSGIGQADLERTEVWFLVSGTVRKWGFDSVKRCFCVRTDHTRGCCYKVCGSGQAYSVGVALAQGRVLTAG